jgi:hypothetical protein
MPSLKKMCYKIFFSSSIKQKKSSSEKALIKKFPQVPLPWQKLNKVEKQL